MENNRNSQADRNSRQPSVRQSVRQVVGSQVPRGRPSNKQAGGSEPSGGIRQSGTNAAGMRTSAAQNASIRQSASNNMMRTSTAQQNRSSAAQDARSSQQQASGARISQQNVRSSQQQAPGTRTSASQNERSSAAMTRIPSIHEDAYDRMSLRESQAQGEGMISGASNVSGGSRIPSTKRSGSANNASGQVPPPPVPLNPTVPVYPQNKESFSVAVHKIDDNAEFDELGQPRLPRIVDHLSTATIVLSSIIVATTLTQTILASCLPIFQVSAQLKDAGPRTFCAFCSYMDGVSLIATILILSSTLYFHFMIPRIRNMSPTDDFSAVRCSGMMALGLSAGYFLVQVFMSAFYIILAVQAVDLKDAGSAHAAQMLRNVTPYNLFPEVQQSFNYEQIFRIALAQAFLAILVGQIVTVALIWIFVIARVKIVKYVRGVRMVKMGANAVYYDTLV